MFKLAFLLLILNSCSSFKSKIVAEKYVLSNWIKNPSLICSSDDICGLGEGNSFESAKANARDEIAKTFSVQVNSRSSYFQGFDSSKIVNQISERQERDIEETTDQVLEGVQIERSGSYDGSFFVLMKINVKIANRILNSSLAKIEQFCSTSLKQNTRGTLFQAMHLHLSWLELVKRWEVINNKKYLKPIFNKVEQALSKKLKTKKLVFINQNDEILRGQFSKFGYEFTTDKSDADIEISYEKSLKSAHLNVEGFFKNELTVHLSLQFKNIGKKEINKNWFIIARTKEQLVVNGNKKVRFFLKNDIFDLLID